MGVTKVSTVLKNPLKRGRGLTVTLEVDTGAFYTLVPGSLLGKLGIRPRKTETFELADGKAIRRAVGWAQLCVDGRETLTEVVFGAKRDAALLGVTTIEQLGFHIDPLRRRLVPIRKFLLH